MIRTPASPAPLPDPSFVLRLTGLHPKVSDQDLVQIYTCFGALLKAKVDGQGYGFVEFRDQASYESAAAHQSLIHSGS